MSLWIPANDILSAKDTATSTTSTDGTFTVFQLFFGVASGGSAYLNPDLHSGWGEATMMMRWCPMSTVAGGNVRFLFDIISVSSGVVPAAPSTPWTLQVTPGGAGDQYELRDSHFGSFPMFSRTAIVFARDHLHVDDTYDGGDIGIAGFRLTAS